MDKDIADLIEQSGDFSKIKEEPQINNKDNGNLLRKVRELYFKPKSFERWQNGRIYEILGTKSAQKILMGTIGKLAKKLGKDKYAGTYFIGERPTLQNLKTFETGTRFNESVHAPQILLTGYELIKYLNDENYGLAIVFGGYLFLNTYCVMLQRYNRSRLARVIERAEKNYKK